MKRLFLVIVLILGFCRIANAQCSGNCVQYVPQSCSPAISCTATVASTVTAHAGFVGVLYANNSSQPITSVTDNQSDTYTCPINLPTLGTHFTEAVCYNCNLTAGVTTVTANFPATGAATVHFMEAKNIASSACADVNTTDGNTSRSQAFSGSTVTTTNATDTLFGIGLDENEGNATFASGTGSGGTVWTNLNGANTSTQIGGGTNCGTAFIGTTTTTVTDNLVYTGSVTHANGYFGDYVAFKGTSTFNADGGTIIAHNGSEKGTALRSGASL
jgi:hypothetical protein